jgi:phosphoglycolate phosphatase
VIRNVIFDWSGTLVDDLPAVWEATNAVFREAGVAELTLDEFRAGFTLPFQDFYRRHLPDVPLRELEAAFHRHFREQEHRVVELPHAREFLVFCRERGLRTLLLSTIHPEHFESQTAINGFRQFLDHPYTGVTDKRERIHEVLSRHSLDPRETLLVGDMAHDIETARHGRVCSCAVLTGYNRLDQLRGAKPDLIVEHLGELRAFLEHTRLEWSPARAALAGADGPRPIVTVGALIFDAAGQVLMIRTQKWSGLWGIPGGKVRWGENCLEALRREIREETALDIDRIEFVLVQDCIDSPEFYRDAHFVLLNYTCRCVGRPEVRLNEEAQAFRWVGREGALALPLNRPTRVLLEAVSARPPRL